MDKTPKTDKKLTAQLLMMYMGCGILYGASRKGKLVGYDADDYGFVQVETGGGMVTHQRINEIRPILRRLEDMTEEEAREIWAIPDDWHVQMRADDNWIYCTYPTGGDEGIDLMQLASRFFLILLSKSFDLFGLIDNNEAIDAKTLNP